MARRKKSSPLEDLMGLVALLPWWAGLALAALSYWGLQSYANASLPAAKTGADVVGFVSSSAGRGLASIGQYLLPLVCTIGALLSYIGRRKRRALLETVTSSSAADALEGMGWHEFELLVGEGFRRQGYAVSETGGGGADGGIDLVLSKAGEKTLVQCKQWKAFKVGVPVVRELYGVMAAQGAASGCVVTSGRFTQEAEAFASGRNIQLIDGQALLQLIRGGSTDKPAQPAAMAPIAAAVPAVVPAAAPASPKPLAATPAAAGDTPTCPVCAQTMLRRVAKKGASAGNAFWGCAGYPKCRGTRPI